MHRTSAAKGGAKGNELPTSVRYPRPGEVAKAVKPPAATRAEIRARIPQRNPQQQVDEEVS